MAPMEALVISILMKWAMVMHQSKNAPYILYKMKSWTFYGFKFWWKKKCTHFHTQTYSLMHEINEWIANHFTSIE